MTQTQKFTPEELSEIKGLRESNQKILGDFGQLEIDIILAKQAYERLAKAKDDIAIQFTELQGQEKKLVDELNKKYGAGTVNLESGEFTPVK